MIEPTRNTSSGDGRRRQKVPSGSQTEISLASLGAAVRGFRQEKGLTQVQLAGRKGLHPTYISQIECGTSNPSFEALTKLCRALGVERWALMRRVDELDGRGVNPVGELAD